VSVLIDLAIDPNILASKPLWASSRLVDRVGKLQYLKKGTIVVTSRRKRCLGAEKSDAS